MYDAFRKCAPKRDEEAASSLLKWATNRSVWEHNLGTVNYPNASLEI